MSYDINHRYTITFSSKPSVEVLMMIQDVFFEHLQLDALDIPHLEEINGHPCIHRYIDTRVVQSFDDQEMIDQIKQLHASISGVISIDISSVHCTYTHLEADGTSEFITRLVLADFVREMVSGLMASFEDVLPRDMMPTVSF